MPEIMEGDRFPLADVRNDGGEGEYGEG